MGWHRVFRQLGKYLDQLALERYGQNLPMPMDRASGPWVLFSHGMWLESFVSWHLSGVVGSAIQRRPHPMISLVQLNAAQAVSMACRFIPFRR
jgi:hypothetical protein